jgi:flagellar hook-associated protein 2
VADSINFGTLTTSGSGVRLTGTSSKLDTESLVRAAYEAKRLPAVRLEAKIAENDARLAAFGELRGLLEDLRSAVNGLRNPPGLLGRGENLFEAKRAYLAGGGGIDPASILGVSLDNSAATSGFEVEVERLATAHKIRARSAASVTQTLADAWNGGTGFTGTVELGLAGGAKASIDVDGDMTLADLAAAINARSSETGVAANLVRVADGDVRLVLSAREAGKAIELADTGIDPVVPLLDPTELVAAQTARIRIDGITVERTGNRIDDVLPGVVLDLYEARPGATVSVTIENDLARIKERIGAFVDAWNALRDFLGKHSQVSAEGEVGSDAVLFGDRTLREIMRALAAEVSGRAFGLDDGALGTLREVGVTMVEGGRLRIDEAKLDRMLLTRLEEVRRVFEFRAVTSSTELAVLGRSNSFAGSSFEVAIVDSDNDGVPESATIGGVAATIAGRRIIGPAGSAFAGLEFAWVGTGTTTITVEVSQGIADRLHNLLGDALAPGNGPLARAVGELGQTNTNYREEIEKINERAEKARAALVEKLTRMETALSLANTLLSQVRAQMDAMAGSR